MTTVEILKTPQDFDLSISYMKAGKISHLETYGMPDNCNFSLRTSNTNKLWSLYLSGQSFVFQNSTSTDWVPAHAISVCRQPSPLVLALAKGKE